MKLTHFFIEHPRFAIVLNVFIVLAGVATMLTLPIAQYPNIVPPTIKVTTLYPGASADVIARTVATPLEQAINGVEGMEYISSQSTGNGQLTITVIFKIGSNADTDLLLTQTRVQNTLSRLPGEVQLQGVQVKKTIDDLLLGVHVYSPDGSRSPEYLSNYMIHVRDELARLPGVADFQLFGDRQYAMRIWIDPDKAAAYNISAPDILAALRAQNAQVSAGVLNQPPVTTKGAYQLNIEALGRLSTPQQFEDVIVKTDSQGRVTRIRDIGRAELGSADYSSLAYADRYPGAPFFVVPTPDANVVELEHQIWKRMAELKKTFPPGVDYLKIYDPATFVSQSIHEVTTTVFIAVLLVVLVVYLFLQSWRATIIPVVAIPVSLIGTFSILTMLGGSINNLSLFGLVLAVGIVVDDAIVVVENVERNMARGLSPLEAAHETMTEVSTALIAIALTLCAVFVPVAFISGIPGLFFKQFAITIAGSTIISCFVSLTLSPALCAILLKPHDAGCLHCEPTGLALLLRPFFNVFNRSFEWLSNKYGAMTSRFVRVTGVIFAVYLALIGLTGLQMSRIATGFIPQQDIGYLAIVCQLPPGSSLARTDEVVRRVNDITLNTRGSKHTSPVSGLDVTTNTVAPNVGTVFTSLPSLYGEHLDGVNAASMVATLRKKFAGFKGANILVVNPPAVKGLGSAGGFKMMLEDRAELGPQALADATNKLVAAARKDPAFASIFTLYNAGSPSVYADIDREKAEKVGLSTADVFPTLELYMGSQYVNDFNLLGRTYPVFVQGDQQFRQTTDEIGRLKVRNANGEMVPISTVATFKEKAAPYRVPRYNLYPASEVMGEPAPGVSSGAALKRIEELALETLPPGITFEWTDLAYQQAKKGIPTVAIFGASALFVFLVLTAQYESWKIPLAIVLIVPMCLLAATTGLNIRTMPIDILAQIGFVVLLGLAAKNAILIVEFAKQRQDHDGVDAKEAAVHSAHVRLRPILMTSLAFIAGVGPLAVAHGAGAEMRQSLGTTVFFGMLGVTIFGLLFTPAFYALVRKGKVTADRPTRASALTTTAASLTILLLTMFLQGCSVGPKYKAPLPGTALAPFHNKLEVSTSSETPAPSLDEWWAGFHDPMLLKIVERALNQNLDLAASLERVNQARAAAAGAGARLFPTGELEASATAEHQSLEGNLGTISRDAPGFRRNIHEYTVGPAASWELDVAGGIRHNAAAARDELQAAEASRIGTRIVVASDAADAYFQIRGYQDRIAIAKSQIETDEHLLKLVQNRYDAGAATKREISQAQALLQQARSTLPPLQLALEKQLNRLDVLLGAQPGNYARELDTVMPVPSIPSIPNQEPVDVLRRRPDIIAAERQLAASNERIGVAIAEYYPKISLAGVLGFDSLNSGSLLTSGGFQPAAVAGLRWRLFDFGRVNAEVKQAQGANAEALIEYRQAVLKATEDVENALASLSETEAYSVEVQAEVESLTRARDLSQEAYRAGSITLTDVLDADRQLLTAQDQLASNRVDTARASVVVFRSFGGGWKAPK
ncbi:efflux RND transporter permease subunit [Occallatibacter savannae]|uniref:efflux RND transporter permease subunit n=1 Tax=Occallatibacter savannae TaxID=1002691 RepID=UPI000D691257|nr:efflux RND transporter permease subunit [Occallatibacter savannae]